MNDTTRRFLNAIVERIPAGGRIVELRLFPAIQQGGIESGVAVVAVEPPAEVPAPDTDAPAEALVVGAAEGFAVAAHDIVDIDVITEDEEGSGGDDTAASSFVPLADAVGEEEVGDALDDEMNTIVVSVSREVIAAEGMATVSGDHLAVDADAGAGEADRSAGVAIHVEPSAATADSPYADAPLPEAGPHRPILADTSAPEGDGEGETPAPSYASVPNADAGAPGEGEETVALTDILALPSPVAAVDEDEGEARGSESARPRRFAILTARYCLTFKGPDRGKWEVEIIHEADAPLDTVERVARGVARRAGEESDPEHFSGESLRLALEAPAWATTP